MKYLIAPLLIALALVPISSGYAQQLDQSNVINAGGGFASETVSSLNQLSQTFTVGRNGLLSEVELQLVAGNVGQISNDLTLTLSRVSSLNTPVGIPLATTTLHLADVPRLDSAGFSSNFLMPIYFSAPPVVAQGDLLSLTLTSAQPYNSSGYYDWILTQSLNIDKYPRGDAWHNPNIAGWLKESYQVDFGFQTFVTPVPEPTALNLFGVAAVVLWWRVVLGKTPQRS